MKDTEKKPKEIVKEIVSKYIKSKPSRITLRLDWKNKRSSINIKADNLDENAEYSQPIDFTSFAHGVIESYKETYGELKVVPVSFREEIYKNDKVSLDPYPTGSAGIFDVFVEYKEE
jgi:hypothetical protein